MRVGLTTGRRVDFHRAIYGRVGQRPRTYCRHGGGILANAAGAVGCGEEQAVAGRPEEVRQRAERPPGLAAEVTRPGLCRGRDREPDRAGAVQDERRRTRALVQHQAPEAARRARPRRTQPGQEAARRGVPDPRPDLRAGRGDGRRPALRGAVQPGLWRLVTPNGRRIALVPGAEGIQFRAGDRRLWAVSESGAPPYARSRKPLTPAVASFGWPRLIDGKPSKCRFRAR